MPKINLRESISEISKTWNYDVTDRTIRNSFAKAGFFVINENSAAEASETLTELDILDSVKNKNITAMNCDEGEDDEDGNDRDAEINKPS
ncbi:hypothetical protein AVEN_66159-1 [Araneus ventricosus]|uniref:DDE-1 domain-containing protein n=1 Tax=Araneus ventricosus TaxID=182803 RepID=A0A4Y2WT75_ARAVE|nr:hypothetical protein AVEN_38834-1 [Araneus ventricosus]GBO40000.1 hypothetical protein AVEN_216374-1 [Araneus ventricosus]GBO40008.1 hypothetical protein AVEN_257902-1 [Araneus ventricosus]GBO40013.1 hypothetical protein AVEN_66159-1 [Araneus ventricosus]